MSLHATDALEDALDATKALLLPVTAATWLRLAVVAFFVGGLGAPVTNFGGTGPGTGGSVDVPFGAVGQLFPSTPLLVALVALVVLLGLVFALVGSVMEFVLVRALATGEVNVRDRFREHLGDGLRLFGFRLLLLLVAVALVGGAVALGFALQGPGIRFLPLLFAVPVVLVVAPVLGAVHGFTTVFVVPVMIEKDVGVVAGWRRFWRTMSGDWTEFGLYLLLSVVLGFGGGAAVAAALGLLAAVVLLPLGLIGGLGLIAAGGTGLSGIGLLLIVAPFVLVAVIVFAALAALVQVPVITYLRYYALFTLGGVDPDLDLVADMREPTGSGGGEGDEPGDETGAGDAGV